MPATPKPLERPVSVLDENVLVLNRNWQAIGFLKVQVSIATAMRDMASVLDVRHYLLLSFDEWAIADHPEDSRWIKTPSSRIAAPEVIVLKKYGERPPRNVNFNRDTLWKRDEFTCQYCGDQLPARQLQIEHVMPRSRGGQTDFFNCVAACASCNARKADKTPEEAGMPLRRKPTKPNWRPTLKIPRETMRPAWMSFLDREAS